MLRFTSRLPNPASRGVDQPKKRCTDDTARRPIIDDAAAVVDYDSDCNEAGCHAPVAPVAPVAPGCGFDFDASFHPCPCSASAHAPDGCGGRAKSGRVCLPNHGGKRTSPACPSRWGQRQNPRAARQHGTPGPPCTGLVFPIVTSRQSHDCLPLCAAFHWCLSASCPTVSRPAAPVVRI